MKKYLLPEKGMFYKANLHCHTTVSDGKYTPEEIKRLYREKGYSVVAYTDHNLFIQHNDLSGDDFLALNGYEADLSEPLTEDKPSFDDILTCHICLIALDKDNDIHPTWDRNTWCWHEEYKKYVKYDENKPDFIREYTSECINRLMKTGRESGFFVTYNHPKWSLESYPQYMAYEGMNAMEIFNTGCYVGGYDEYNPDVYDDMLRGGKKLYCIAADDNHGDTDMFGGFVMIKAENLEYSAVTKALENGDFYASRGPEIKELWFEDDKVHIKSSNAKSIYFMTGRRRSHAACGEDGGLIDEAEFEVKPEDRYIRLTVVDSEGNTANTNAYFTDKLFD